jgi:hypothetical protein
MLFMKSSCKPYNADRSPETTARTSLAIHLIVFKAENPSNCYLMIVSTGSNNYKRIGVAGIQYGYQ